MNISSDWKFNEVTAEFALTNHVVQPIFLAISSLTWAKLSPEQQATLKAAAREGADVEIAMTRKQETDARAAFEAAGVIISTPDLEPFHAKVDALYAQPGMMDAWMPGLVDQIKAID